MKFDQWSLPVRFVTFVAVCFLALSEITTRQVFVYARAVIVFFFLLGAVHLADQQLVSREYLAQADFLLEQCRKQGVCKAVVRTERLKPGIPVMNTAYQDILVWSALKYPGSPVQVVYADDEYYPPVEQMSADEIILDQAGPILRHRDLNPRYYNLPEEKYREIAISGSAD